MQICKWLQIIRYLVKDTKIDMKATNLNGQTAMDILDFSQLGATKNEIKEILEQIHCNPKTLTEQVTKWQTEKGNAIMVVAVLIATVAFQAGVSPAGGIWQENSTQQDNLHGAGEAVVASTHPEAYKNLIRANTIAFVSSVTTILLLISGLPFTRRVYMWIMMILASLTVSYAISIFVVTPKTLEKLMPGVLKIGLGVCFAVMGILFMGSKAKWLEEWLKKTCFANNSYYNFNCCSI
ncbi:hypothetical protein BUALT_Bualt10G0129900 [Buddleja alternifolia]|uniref:PGG domain-containing protein n=1 Tax=Buddleja alternifolia TaxID=168488 RepID=A0AAV6X5K6_9LAMI|nr:hypothetical protein BUALT_Bualt10G0129900 [Buddleja alternifolia]